MRAILRTAFDLGDHPFRPRQQLRAAARLGRDQLRRAPAQRFSSASRRARDLHQGRLRHVAGTLRRVGKPQIPARQPRPEPEAHGARLRRHLLFAPLRPRDAARGDDGRARHGGAPGQGALCRDILLQRRSRTREAAAILESLGTPCLIHQPTYSLVNRWIERTACSTRSPRRASAHRVLAAGAGASDRQVPERDSGRQPRRGGAFLQAGLPHPRDARRMCGL